MKNQDQVDITQTNKILEPYSLEELSVISLPGNLARHTNEIKMEEGKEPYEQTIKNLTEVTSALNSKMEGEEYAFTGSMSMYALWYDFMNKKPNVDIKRVLNQRVKGGKNDFDIAIREERKLAVMEDKLGFDEDAVSKQRGVVGNHMVDIQVRPSIKDFPYKEVDLGGEKVLVQNPIEGIFERMSALAYEQIGNDGEVNSNEVKWGVDTKLLKLYVMLSEGLTKEKLEEKLASLWNKYQKGKKYGYVEYLASQVKEGKDQRDLLLPGMRKFLNEDISIEELPEKMKESFSGVPPENIDNLLYTKDLELFKKEAKQLIDSVTPKGDSYEEMREKANENYNEIT